MPKHVVGAQMYTVRESLQTPSDVVESLKKVADIGYTAIQDGFASMDPKEVAKVVQDCGLRIVSTHVRWDRCLSELDDVIAEYKLWDCDHLVIPMLPREYYSVDGLKRFLDELAPIAERLAAEGIDLSYHNHNHELARYGQETWLEMLYEQADPKMLKAELDTYWIQAGGGDPASWIRKCAGREPLLHLKDMIVTPGREQRFAEIGEGNLNWPAILKAAAEGGVEWYLVEQDQCYDRDPFESLAISYRNLKEMGLS
ncbi:MAG: sugar phosphate isomerase/epimerase [Chloroflexota bacterium]|nr:sugar phosphate isomerase/epimerase [Chloroflexota bacterium]